MTLRFLRGLLIGLAVAAPVGPIALLILRRSLKDGRLAGFVSGLGAATADLICGTIAAFGLTALISTFETHHNAIQLVGGVFMIVMGVHTLRAQPPTAAANRPLHERNLLIAFFTTCLLTLVNPLTLVGITGVIAAAGFIGGTCPPSQVPALAAGIFLGSASWWLLLSAGAAWLGRKLGNRTLEVLNRGAGWAIVAFGCWQLLDLAI